MIKADHLTRFFGKNKVVNEVSFSIGKGEILGFLGPNGAGKSTTMRMLTGFIPPSSGTAVICGHDIRNHPLEVRRSIGYLPEAAPVYPDMTVQAFLEFIARVRGFSGREKKRVVDETIEKSFLPEVRRQTVGTLSKGYRQRVCFAQSILHDPPVLIMDEPTDGLDPNQKHEVRTMIREMGRNKAIILCTHILEEVEAVCSRAIIIARGAVVADDTPEGLKARSRSAGTVRVVVRSGPGFDPEADLKALQEVKDVVVLSRDGGRADLRVYPAGDPSETARGIMQGLDSARHTLESVYVESGRLDEVFRTITQA
ncbi:MAG: ATP-binding cassette domain-containing protein [Proteobacteria bacterium]|nr:ATP-binding cassette domain-containing protein [Pseudomonadota bacterium]